MFGLTDGAAEATEAQIHSFGVNRACIEDGGPCLLIKAAARWAGNGQFTNINYTGQSDEVLVDITAAPNSTYFSNSAVTSQNIGFGNAVGSHTLSVGTAPADINTATLRNGP
jgi:hypothetical protein